MTENEMKTLAKLIAAELRKAPLPVETRTEKRERRSREADQLAQRIIKRDVAMAARGNDVELHRSVHAES